MNHDISKFDVFEGITSISAVIKSIREGSSDRVIDTVYYDGARAAKKSHELGFLKHAAAELGFKLSPADADFIDSCVSGNTHGGLIMLCTKRSFPDLNVNFLTNANFFALIEGIEDPYNFGYALRSLYAAGASGVILSPRNWMSVAGIVCRASAGASELCDTYICENPTECVNIMKSLGVKIICADMKNSVSIYDANLKKPLFLAIGGEKRGLSRELLDAADAVIRLDYGRDFPAALSAASAAAVAGFEILRQNRK